MTKYKKFEFTNSSFSKKPFSEDKKFFGMQNHKKNHI